MRLESCCVTGEHGDTGEPMKMPFTATGGVKPEWRTKGDKPDELVFVRDGWRHESWLKAGDGIAPGRRTGDGPFSTNGVGMVLGADIGMGDIVSWPGEIPAKASEAPESLRRNAARSDTPESLRR